MNFVKLWVKRLYDWLDDRSGLSKVIGPILTHAVPKTSEKTAWAYVFGSATLFAFSLQVVTGITLALAYVPASGEAYSSLQYITGSGLGSLLRAMHYFGASAMVLLIGIHMVRTFLMAAYKYPRELSWVSGVMLLGLTMAMGFTGQLLRWDQNGVWSVIVAAAQAGRVPVMGPLLAHFILAGDTVGGATLSRFFAFHVFFIPAIIFGLVGFHLYLVLHNGISEPPKSGRPVDPVHYRRWYWDLIHKHGEPFWPDAAWRDVVFGVLMVAAVVFFSWYWGPPELTNPPNPALIKANPRPDWYLLWYFGMLALLPPATEDYVIVYGPLVAGLVLILLPFFSWKGERSPYRRPWAMAIVLLVVVMIGTLWRLALSAPWSPAFETPPLPQSEVGAVSGPVADGAQLFYLKGCLYCHRIGETGGSRGPDLSAVGTRLSHGELVWRIMNGSPIMPAYAGHLNTKELEALVAFLEARRGGGQKVPEDSTLRGPGGGHEGAQMPSPGASSPGAAASPSAVVAPSAAASPGAAASPSAVVSPGAAASPSALASPAASTSGAGSSPSPETSPAVGGVSGSTGTPAPSGAAGSTGATGGSGTSGAPRG
jgi:ubiquinol-cytochrome c reductase cytochrome b subunit